MLSGIGPKIHLNALEIDTIADLPVGHNLQDHMVLLMFSRINSSVSITADLVRNIWSRLRYTLFGTGPLSFVATDGNAFLHIDESQKDQTYAEIQMEFLSMLIPHNAFNFKDEIGKEYIVSNPNTHGFTTAVFNTHPKSRGEIKLRSKDPFDYPNIDPKYLSDQRDIKELIAGLKLWEIGRAHV